MRRQFSVIALLIGLSFGSIAAPRAESTPGPGPAVANRPAMAVPDWYAEPPQTDKDLSAAAAASGPDLRFALDKAVLAAKYDLSDRLRDRLGGTMKKMLDESGGMNDPRLVQAANRLVGDLFTDVDGPGYRVARQKAYTRRDGHQVYVLVEYCIADANKALVRAIGKNDAVKAGLRASATLGELEAHYR